MSHYKIYKENLFAWLLQGNQYNLDLALINRSLLINWMSSWAWPFGDNPFQMGQRCGPHRWERALLLRRP